MRPIWSSHAKKVSGRAARNCLAMPPNEALERRDRNMNLNPRERRTAANLPPPGALGLDKAAGYQTRSRCQSSVDALICLSKRCCTNTMALPARQKNTEAACSGHASARMEDRGVHDRVGVAKGGLAVHELSLQWTRTRMPGLADPCGTLTFTTINFASYVKSSQTIRSPSRAAKQGRTKRAGSRSGLVLHFLSFFVLFLSRFSGIFPICSGTFRGLSRFVPFPLSRPIKSTYEERSRKGQGHNLDLSRKKWETPRPGLASLNSFRD